MDAFLMVVLEGLFYAILSAAGVFIIFMIRSYNLQNEVLTLVAAAEMFFPGSGRGSEKKEWVLQEIKNKFPSVNIETIDKIIESFVFELTK